MTSTDVEVFLGAGRSLADRSGLPTTRPQLNQSWQPGEVRTIQLSTMLGQVGILPQQTDRVSLAGYGGDEEMISRLQANVHGGVLTIEGELPFKAGSAGRGSGSQYTSYGDNNTVIIGGVNMGNVHFGGGSASFSSGGKRTLIVNGREVDLERSIQLALIVPIGTNIRIGDMVGAVGIGPNLYGTLDFNARFDTHVFAYDVSELSGTIGGQGHVDVQLVEGDADVRVSGQGDFVLGSVCGKLDAQVSGQGNIRVAGGNSRSMRGRVSGQGSIGHFGTVTGDATLKVSGMGSITASRVTGYVDHKVSGMGSITANGQVHRPRW